MDQTGLPGSRWPVTLAPLAAAVAVAAAAVMAGPPAAFGATHTRAMTSRANLVHQVIAYVTAAGKHTGTVTPIRTATNTALPPLKVGQGPEDIAVTPDVRTVYAGSTASDTVTPIRTATGTALPPITTGQTPQDI